MDKAARHNLEEINVDDLVGQAVPLSRLYKGTLYFPVDIDSENRAFGYAGGNLEELLLVEKYLSRGFAAPINDCGDLAICTKLIKLALRRLGARGGF
jgi:hypothetical protein